jgi:sRNA-binding regulator protein Hfq
MSLSSVLPPVSNQIGVQAESGAARPSGVRGGRARKGLELSLAHFSQPSFAVEGTGQRQAELFYLQKQIHAQTPMVIVMEDGERVEGCIEWYDRNSIKVRGRVKSLVYKSAIKYMYKVGEGG